MAQLIQILFYSMYFLSVYGHRIGRTNHELDQMPQDRLSLSDLLNLSKLLESAARLTYPITTSINKIVSDLGGYNNYPPTNDYDSYKRYPKYPADPRLNRYNHDRNAIAADLQNPPRMNIQDVHKRQFKKPSIHGHNGDFDYEYNAIMWESYDSSEIGDDSLFHKFNTQLDSKFNLSNNDEKVVSAEKRKNAPNHKSVPIPYINDLKPIAPLHPSLDAKNDEDNSNDLQKTSATELNNKLYISSPNSENQKKNGIPITNLIDEQSDHLMNSAKTVLPDNISKLKKKPLNIYSNDGNDLGNAFVASDDAQPNIIYVILNASDIDPDSIHKLNLLNNKQPKPNENVASNTDGGYTTIPTAESLSLKVNNAVSSIPANSSSEVNLK